MNKSFFARFKQLRTLNLAENELTWTINRATFGKYSRLTEIDLTQNKSIKVVLLQIPHLKKIEFDVSEHLASCSYINTLRIRKLTPEVIRVLGKLNYNYGIRAICLSGCSIQYFKRNANWKSELEAP